MHVARGGDDIKNVVCCAFKIIVRNTGRIYVLVILAKHGI
jgi:hypothetical protein